MTVSKLGATIKDAQKAKGLTQEALAKEMQRYQLELFSKWELAAIRLIFLRCKN